MWQYSIENNIFLCNKVYKKCFVVYIEFVIVFERKIKEKILLQYQMLFHNAFTMLNKHRKYTLTTATGIKSYCQLLKRNHFVVMISMLAICLFFLKMVILGVNIS